MSPSARVATVSQQHDASSGHDESHSVNGRRAVERAVVVLHGDEEPPGCAVQLCDLRVLRGLATFAIGVVRIAADDVKRGAVAHDGEVGR
jgi:hypothetical protein